MQQTAETHDGVLAGSTEQELSDTVRSLYCDIRLTVNAEVP
jgi:hypothetical protein